MFKNGFLTLSVILIISCLQSCKKDNSDTPPVVPPVIPPDTVVTFLPSSLSFISANHPEENVSATLKYSLDDHTIKVYSDDPATSNPYDLLGVIYYYDDNGYLIKKESFDENGTIIETFTVERDNDNILKRVLVEQDGYPLKDTFNFSFSDSAAGYKIMKVDTRYRDFGSDLKISDEYTFLNDKFIKGKGGTFSDGISNITISVSSETYDASGKLSSKLFDPGNETIYSYEATGKGLDSFYHVLSGKDGYYLSTYDKWTTVDKGIYFFPLYQVFADPVVETDAVVHRDGVIKKLRSMPSDVTFDFENTFDANSRISETKFLHDGVLTGTWKVTY